MSLNQVTIEIPLNIQKGLDSGIYKRYGSIIRNTSDRSLTLRTYL